MVGDHGSPCPMRERDSAAFAAAGFVLIPESDRVNALAEAQIAKLPAGYKRNEVGGRAVRITSSHTGCGSVESKIGRLNRTDRFFPRLVSKAPWCNRANPPALL